jgi:hypothetical protein
MMNINLFEDIVGQAAVDAAVDIDHDAQFVHQKSHLTK